MKRMNRRIVGVVIAIVFGGLGAGILGAVEPADLARAIQVAESQRTATTAIALELVSPRDRGILSVRLEDGTNVEVSTADWTVVRVGRPVFARRHRRVGRAVGMLGEARVALSEVYADVLSAEESAPLRVARNFSRIAYAMNRRRVMVQVEFGGPEGDASRLIYADARTGEIIDLPD